MTPFEGEMQNPQALMQGDIDAELQGILGEDMPQGMLLAPVVPEVALPEGWDAGSLEDRLDLRVRLTDEQQIELGQQLSRESGYWDQVVDSRLMNASDWRDDASMMPDPGIFDGRDLEAYDSAWRAQNRSMLSRTAAAKAWQGTMQQIVLPSPPFVAEPLQPKYVVNGREYDLMTEAPAFERALAYYLDQQGWREACSELFMEEAVASPTAMRVQYAREAIMVPKRMLRQDDEALQGLLMAGVHPGEALTESIETDQAGLPRVHIEWEEKVVKEGPEFTVIPMEELLFFPATARYQKECFAIGERVRLRGSFLMEKKQDRRSGYFPDAIDRLLAASSDQISYAEEMAQQRAAINADLPTENDLPEHREYQCVELAYKGRLGGEKFDKWYWITFHPSTRTVLRCCYMLDRHGDCPYEVFNYFGNQLMGMGIMMLNATYQTQYTTLWNYFLDLVTILANSGGSVFYDPTSGYDPYKYVLSPGAQIPIRRPKDSVFPFPIASNITQALQFILEALEKTKGDSQLLTSTSNVSLGKEADGEKTLGEVQMVFAADQQIQEMNAFGTALKCAKVAEKFRMILAQYARKGKLPYSYADSDGKTQYGMIDPELMAAPYRLVPAGLTASSSAMAQYQKASLALQTVLNSPLATVPEVVFDAVQKLLQSLVGPAVAGKWISLAKEQMAREQALQQQMMAQQQVAQQQQEGQQQEQAALQQGNVEADRALQERQLMQAEEQQGAQNQLAQGEQALKLLSMGTDLEKAKMQSAARPNGANGKANR